MKPKRLFLRNMIVTLVVACAALVPAQGQISNDLLQTGTGTQENLSSLGLGTVTFKGVALSTDTGPADTIVQHQAIPSSGGTVNTQVIALHLMNSGTVTCGNASLCGSYLNQSVDVHATINATNGILTLPQPDILDPSVGTMTVFTTSTPGSYTFNSSFSTIEADLIVVPAGAGVNATPIFTSKGPAAAMSASGGTMSNTPPFAYPTSQNFPTVAPYVLQVAGGTAAFLTGPFGKIFRGSLWGLGCLFLGLAFWRVRSTLNDGVRLGWRPAYLTTLALVVGFMAWRLPSYAYPKIVHAEHCPIIRCTGPTSAEQGLLIQHGVAPAQTQCQIIPCPFPLGAE